MVGLWGLGEALKSFKQKVVSPSYVLPNSCGGAQFNHLIATLDIQCQILSTLITITILSFYEKLLITNVINEEI